MPKTLQQGLDKFLQKLQPLNTEHQKATKHKKSVESCLKNNFECYKFFETGSFGSKTGIRHFSDTDYFAVISQKKVSKNSSICLRNIKKALQYTFSSTEGIEVKCPSVAIPFGNYSSETMEVTPCLFKGFVNTPLKKFPAYHIADCSGKWMLSSPDAHNAYVRKHDKRLKYRLKPLIQLIKAWKYFNNVPLNSFYLELRITKYCEGKKTINYGKDLKYILNHLTRIELGSIRDPMGISGLINPSETIKKKTESLSKLNRAKSRANKAIITNEKNKINESFEWFDKLFNGNFPSR